MTIAAARIRAVADGVVTQIQTLTGSGTAFIAARSLSLWFPDSSLSLSRVSVIPEDVKTLAADRAKGQEVHYELRVTVQDIINRTDLAGGGDMNLDLTMAIHDMFPQTVMMTLTGETADKALELIEKRFAPLVFRNALIMDLNAPQTRFVSTLMLTWREWVKP